MWNSDYIIPTNKLKGQNLSWRIGGLKTMLGLLIKEFGATKVKQSVDEIIQDSKGKYVLI